MQTKKMILSSNIIKVLPTIKDLSVDLLCTDPPYKITPRGTNGTMDGMLVGNLSLAGNIFQHNDIHISEYAGELFRILKDGSHAYIMCNHKNLQIFLNELTKVGFHFIKCLIWNKGNKIAGRFYMNQFEYILFLRKGKGVAVNDCGISDIIEIPNKKTKINKKIIHPTEKPVELMKLLISQSTKENDVVLDPFMGSGSTGVACKLLNRQFIGIEIDEVFYNIAKERIEETSIVRERSIEDFLEEEI